MTRALFALAFFVSGAAALIYQYCWNRYLFAAIGVDLDSTSIIVSTFMLGLGLGNALGSKLAQRIPSLWVFAWIELGLLIFGVLSPSLLVVLGDWMVGFSRTGAAVSLFGFLLIPTLLMGATLPVMCEAASRVPALRSLNFSALYLVNTLGAAVGVFLVSVLLIGWLGLSRSIWVAAGANALAALLVLLTIWHQGQRIAGANHAR